jgi:N-acetylglucosaminyldiphosphoundecaprenol N-acetyl-beta-D-mannosaminyltransferase
VTAVQDDVATFPPRVPISGILISRCTYDDATAAVIRAAHAGVPAAVAATSVHGLTLGAIDPTFGYQLNSIDMLTPDGQPVRWAMNLLHGTGLRERVYGPTLMLHICRVAALEGLPVYLYGSRPDVLERLVRRLSDSIPALRIAGYRAPPFRPLSDEEVAADVEAIRTSGARIVFVGLGCPRQERWAAEHRAELSMPIVCVGAAFDFHAGVLRQAPGWIQDHGLEWLFRLAMEPRRLWRRYTKHVPLFVVLVAQQFLAMRLSPARQRLEGAE